MSNYEVLAVVGGKELTTADLDAFLEKVPPEQKRYAANPQFRPQFIEQLIILHSYAKLGEDLKLEETEEFKAALAAAKRDILAQMAMDDTLKNIVITDEEAMTFYKENPMHFEKPETVSAKHILVAEEEVCNQIKAAIENGEKTFEEAAKESSTCPSGQEGGSLGEFGKGQMVPEFEEAAFAAEAGQVVGPVKTQFGYHLILVDAHNEPSLVAFEDISAEIKETLVNQRKQEVYMNQIKILKEKYVQMPENA